MQYHGKFDKPALFIKGSKSNYYADGDQELIKSIFTNSSFATLDTGHWVQAEKPIEFANTVVEFLTQK